MRTLRRLYRLILLPLWLLLYAVWCMPARYLKRGENSGRIIAGKMRAWGYGIAWILGYRLHIHGDPKPYQEKGGLIISNHQSYMDVIMNACIFGCRFTPKIEVKKWPFFGWYVGLNRPLWIDRKNRQCAEKIMKECRRTLQAKIPLVVYPEGTTTDGRNGLLPFKTTFFESVVRTDIPIQPLINVYHPHRDDYHPAWFGTATFLPHLWALLGNHTIDTDIYILPQIMPKELDRKALAIKAHDIMQDAYQQHFIPDERKEYVE